MSDIERQGHSDDVAAEPSDRRSFLKTTMAGALGAAAMAGAGGAAEAAQARGFKGTVSAQFSPRAEITLDDLQNVIAQIVRENGCRACGLIGYDIRLARVNPATRLRNINLKNAEVLAQEIG